MLQQDCPSLATIEDRSYLYSEAIEVGRQIRNMDFSEVDTIVEFLRKWNRARGYDKKSLMKALSGDSQEFRTLIEKFEEKRSRELGRNDLEEFLNGLIRVLRKVTGKTETVGSIKLAHVLYPEIFPLLDNRIAEKLRIKHGNGLGINEYLEFKAIIDGCIFELRILLEDAYKRVDELLYLCYTREKEEELEKIFNEFGQRTCWEVIQNILQCLKGRKD